MKEIHYFIPENRKELEDLVGKEVRVNMMWRQDNNSAILTYLGVDSQIHGFGSLMEYTNVKHAVLYLAREGSLSFLTSLPHEIHGILIPEIIQMNEIGRWSNATTYAEEIGLPFISFNRFDRLFLQKLEELKGRKK